MGDVHIPQEDPTTSQRIGAKVQGLIDSGHEFYATAATGSPTGRTRRPTLFIVTALGIIVSLVLDGTVGFVAGGIALIAMLLLAMTDNVVDLIQ
jgi:hypothetical protein